MSATETDISKMKVRIKSFIYLVCVCIDDNKHLEHQSQFAISHRVFTELNSNYLERVYDFILQDVQLE